MKLYNNGLVIGRFQGFHKGHEFLIKRALKLCKRVYLYIGSSQEKGTEKNPFSYEFRKSLIDKVFKKEIRHKRLFVGALPDMGYGNSIAWGEFVLNRVRSDFNVEIDLYVTGCEKERSSWFTNEIAPNMDELRLTRHNIKVSATQCRELIISNNYNEWKLMIPRQLHNDFNLLRKELRRNGQ